MFERYDKLAWGFYVDVFDETVVVVPIIFGGLRTLSRHLEMYMEQIRVQ